MSWRIKKMKEEDDGINVFTGKGLLKTKVIESNGEGMVFPVRIQRALLFDGVDDYVSIAHNIKLNFGTGDFSLVVWLKIFNQASNERIVLRKDFELQSPRRFYDFTLTGPYIRFQVYDSTVTPAYVIVMAPYSVNVWYHIAGVRESGQYSLYLNGELKATITESVPHNVDNIGPVVLGRYQAYLGGYFYGIIDEVRIYNRALSESEIKWLYNNGRGRPGQVGIRDGCVLCLDPSRWRGSSWVKDISGCGNHGLILGATRVRREF